MSDFRTKGLGKKIVENALRLAKKLGKKDLYAMVDTDNIPAQKILDSVGFTKQKSIAYFKVLTLKRWNERIFKKMRLYDGN